MTTTYSTLQQKYIDSVEGNAHMSAVQIIGELENALGAMPVVIDKKIGRDDCICYGYACPSCGQKAIYDKHLSENTVVFVCAFCGAHLLVSGVNFEGAIHKPGPFILPKGWDLEDSKL